MCLDVFSAVWESMELHPERMAHALGANALATDLADYLVRKGTPFRDAHRIVGGMVRQASESGRSLADLGLEELRLHSDVFDTEALELLGADMSLKLRNIEGGTGPEAVRDQLEKARSVLAREAGGT